MGLSRTVCPTLDEISRQFFAALEEARINRQQNKNTAESGGVEVKKSIKINPVNLHKNEAMIQ